MKYLWLNICTLMLQPVIKVSEDFIDFIHAVKPLKHMDVAAWTNPLL